MKKLLILLLAPFFGFAQLNLIDLKNMANQKADFSIDYIKQKGYSYRQERDIPDGTKQLYYEKGKLSRTLVVLKVGPNSNNLISYVPETATNYNEILNSVKKDNFQLMQASPLKANIPVSLYTAHTIRRYKNFQQSTYPSSGYCPLFHR